MSRVQSLIAEARQQWRANVRLRFGVAVIAGVVWLWALLVLMDAAKAFRGEAEAARQQADQWRPLIGQTAWPARVDEARSEMDAARSLQWAAASTGAAEARLQDYLRSLAEKGGLNVVELTILQGAAEAASSAAGGVLRARLVTDLNRPALMALLAELQGAQPMVIVDVIKLRPAQVPARAELELRAQMRVQSVSGKSDEVKP
ncbi:GspMb/PilO family protein [Roseateles sp. P5_E11]